MTRRRIEAGIGRAVGLVGASVLLAGCLSPKEDPTRFYVLSTSDASQVDEAWDGRTVHDARVPRSTSVRPSRWPE